jgi:hypothetical protein
MRVHSHWLWSCEELRREKLSGIISAERKIKSFSYSMFTHRGDNTYVKENTIIAVGGIDSTHRQP